ncbi:MAG: hypothetical protein Q9180_000958 [Flavoplaca navasiana]
MYQSALPLGNASHSPSKNGFQEFHHGATDLVSAAEFNSSGTHLAVKWIAPTLGSVLGTIADDARFKLWREDSSQAPKSGRRFRCIFSQSPSSNVSYVSFDFKTVRHEVCLAMVQRDGLLALFEPSEPDFLNFEKELDSVYPFGQQSRGSEPIFKLSFHHAVTPSYQAISAGVDPRSITLALSAANAIKILRATRSEDGNCRFYQVLLIEGIASAINDVAWAPGSIRPYNLIAAACNDGCVRVFQVTTPQRANVQPRNMSSDLRHVTRDRRSSSKIDRHTPSGIGAGLAGFSGAEAMYEPGGESHVEHSWKEAAVLHHEGGLPVWRVRWTHDGKYLPGPFGLALAYESSGSSIASTGDSGRLQLWKQSLDGHFIVFAETGPV